jgi:SAM-dependent methyltransferase
LSGWQVTTAEWRAWAVEDDPAIPALDRVDDFDDSLREQLEKARFPAGDETTLMRPNPARTFDSMTTLIREAPAHGAPPDADTVITPMHEPPTLTVQLVGPDGDPEDLEVTLRPPSRERTPAPSELRALIDDESVDDDAVMHEVAEEDELYIPSLTKAAPVAAAAAPAAPAAPLGMVSGVVARDAPLPPPPELSFDEASAPAAIGVTDAWERHASGELGGAASEHEPEPPPPPRRRVEVSLPDASTSQTSGVIQMADDDDDDDDDDAAATRTRGARTEVAPPTKVKIVVDPTASGASYEHVADDDVEELAEAEAAEELDDADLVEEAEPARARAAIDRPAPEPRPDVPPPRPVAPPSAPTVDSAALAAADVQPAAPARTGQTLPPGGGDLGWVDAVFGEHYPALLPDTHEQRALQEVDFVLACTRTPAGARVLDVGCGDGAHCFAFAARGMQVTGFDASMVQLMRATAMGEARGNPCAFLKGDMRDPPVQGVFALVTCVGSSFGYFDDETNEKVLQRLARLVAPGGHLVLHVFNRERMVGRLPARSWWQGRGCLVLDEASFDSLTSRLAVHRTVVFEDGRQFDHTVTMRAFGLADLAQLCQRVGLVLQEYSGGIHTRGHFFGSTSADIWLVARRQET